jgi:hypothetical protein
MTFPCAHAQPPGDLAKHTKAGADMKKDPPANTTIEEKEDQLRKLGFSHVPPHALRSAPGRRGKFLSVSGFKGVPKALNFSAELAREVGLERGSYVDVFQSGDKLAIVAGSGEVVLTKSGTSLHLSCSRLLEHLGLKVGDRLTANAKDGVIFTVARSAEPTKSGASQAGGR